MRVHNISHILTFNKDDFIGPMLRISANVNSDFAQREHLRDEIGVGD